MRRPTLIAAGLTAAMLAARLFGAAPLSDPTGASLPASLHLHFPLLNTLLAPLFDTWDGVSMLGMHQLRAFFIWAAVAIVLWRWIRRRRWSVRAVLAEFAMTLGSILALLAFGLVGLVWHRPMVSLAGV
ncbi:MAG TPA: hypothetical protein VLC11_00465, partial [Gemmatimonadales bacterium]|nr:hypothetical protein [Gemmatimonadales bacterium]